MLKTVQLFASLLLLLSLCSCNKSPSEAKKNEQTQAAKTEEQKQEEAADIIRKRDQLEAKAQEEAAKIREERENRAEVQQQQREKVAEDIAKRTDTKEAARAANLERAAAEQARRERITSELAKFIDTSWIEIMRSNATEELRINSQPVTPGSVIVSPAGYSVTYRGHDGDDFSFTYDQDAAFTLTFKRPYDGLSLITMKAKQPLADGFEVGQPLSDFGSTKPRTPSSLPDSPATPQRNLFDGTWVGTINGHAGLVKFTIAISGGGTVWSASSRLRPNGRGPRDATNDGKTMKWYWGIQNKELVTFTPNPDGKTAIMTSEGPAIRGKDAYNVSATFHRMSP
jgi:hypothetical protein